jgi:hypothetical protein
VTTTLSPPVQIFAVLGVVAAIGFAAFTFLSGGEASVAPPAPIVRTEQPTTPAKRRDTTPNRLETARATQLQATMSGFPVPVNQALRKRRVVVVAVGIPQAKVDRVVAAEALIAARATGAGFVVLSALNEKYMSSLVAKTGVLPDPAVLVVRRPGVVTATFSVSDAHTIGAAVAQARARK